MPLLSRFAILLAAILLCAPAAAIAQTSTLEQEGAGVSTQPPVDLGPGDEEPQASSPPAAAAPADPSAGGDLPNTGSDPRLLFLAGVALMLFGVGLRLRTADADLY